MYSNSDEEQENTEEDDFAFHEQEKIKKQMPNMSQFEEIESKCWKLHQEIIEEKKKYVSDKLIELCNEFCGILKDEKKIVNDSSEDEQEQKQTKQKSHKSKQKKGQKNDKTSKEMRKQLKEGEKINLKTTKLIIPICIRKSQQQYLQQFGQHFITRLKQLTIPSEEQQEQVVQPNKDRQKFKILIGARKVNVFYKQYCPEVSRIALLMHKNMKQIHIERKDISIYFSKEVTNLSPENLYILEEGLPDAGCITIVPTFSSFEEVLYNRFSKIEIIPFRLFQHKSAFSQLMYKCICDSQIKAYLPKEAVKLLDDFDDFPITYKEGTRRLIHCLHRLEMLKQRKKYSFRYIEVRLFFKAIEKALKKVFGFFHEHQCTATKYVKSILDENQIFNILDKYLNKHNFFGREELNQSETDLVVDLRNKLVYYIEKEDNIKIYSGYLKNDKLNPLKKQRSRQDLDCKRYQIDSKNNLDEKGLLQVQIRQAITHLTNQIRQQANKFKWQQFYYMQQIKPMLPYNIFNSVKQSPVHAQLIEYIYSSICTPLSKVIDVFCQQQDMAYGQLMYYMKDLEMYGLIDVSESTLKPLITPAFFEKASYKTRKQG